MLKGILGSQAKSADHWRTVVADLESRMAVLREQIQKTAQQRADLATAAAAGDLEARGKLERANESDLALWGEFDRLQPTLVKAKAELAALDQRQRSTNRKTGMAALRKILAQRLDVASEIENLLRALSQDIEKLGKLGADAQAQYAALVDGGPQLSAVLDESATALRISRFAASLGLSRYFPLATQDPPLKSLSKAEFDAEQSLTKAIESEYKTGTAG